MTQTIYGMISDNGDGSSSMWWFRELPDEEKMMDKNPETWGMSEGIAETLTFPADLDLSKCGFHFNTMAEALGEEEDITEDMNYDEDGYIIWNGGDRPVDVDTIVAVKVRSGIPRSPVASKHWPQITWRHRSVDDPMNQWDIVAYKVMK